MPFCVFSVGNRRKSCGERVENLSCRAMRFAFLSLFCHSVAQGGTIPKLFHRVQDVEKTIFSKLSHNRNHFSKNECQTVPTPRFSLQDKHFAFAFPQPKVTFTRNFPQVFHRC